MKLRWLLIAAVAVAAAALGAYFGRTQPLPAVPAQAVAVDAATKLATLPLSTPEGKPVKLEQWAGQILVINFWATWCPPCREEMPAFSRVHNEFKGKGVQFVGIGIDTPDNILAFQQSHPVSYPLLLGSYDALKLSKTLGNDSAALPFTVILDRNGALVHARMGRLDELALQALLAPMLTGNTPAKL